ncbi:MAG TPA: tetratricopeptide repeat protein, partial [Polyangiaceae bacterium]
MGDPLAPKDFSAKDFSGPLDLVIKGDRAGAAAALAGVVFAAYAGPLAGAAASGLVHRMAKLFTDTATRRFVEAGQAWDSEEERKRALGAYFAEVVAPSFARLSTELTKLAREQREEFLQSRELQDEYFERTLRFMHRNLASREGQEKTHEYLNEVMELLREGVRGEGSEPPVLFEGPGRVPAKAVPFFSAQEELAELCELLAGPSEAVCVVAHGMGGVGKTVLAHELVARRAAELFPAGAAWIDAPSLALDLPRVARRFGWPKDRDPTLEEACEHLGRELHERPVLLVVDNVDPAVQKVATLPFPGGKARTLVTSRDVSLAGSLGARVTSSALKLGRWNTERCRDYLKKAAPQFERENAADLDALGTFVGGLALALHLVAGQPRRKRGLRAAELLTELRAAPLDTLDRFVDKGADGIERGVLQTFIASLTALSEDERQSLRALAVCAEGTRHDIVAAVAKLGPERTRAALDHLADVSLAEYVDERAAAPWGLHDVVRLLVREQHALAPFEAAHRTWLDAHLAAHADPTDYAAFDIAVPEGLASVERLVERGEITEASTLFYPLFRHLARRGEYARALAAGSRILVATGDDALRAQWLGNLGNCYRTLGDIPKAIHHHQRSLAHFEKLGSLEGQAIQLGNLGSIYAGQGKQSEARAALGRSLAL